MFTNKSVFRILSVLFAVLMLSGGTASARPLEAVFDNGFTYQGKLTDGGAPANGSYDLQFSLYDALSSGNQIGSTVTKEDVTVTAGLFTVQLDFGNVFDGTALYLEVGVRPGASTDAYTPLTARQALSATPYASYAAQAPWSGITGMPAGFSDSVDDNTTYTAGDGLDLAGTQFKGKGTSYQNVVIVAKSGGDFTSIQAALDSITAASDTNRYLVYVAPGVYTERVTMKEYIDIEGAGELTTKITFTGSSDLIGTVMGANNAELRFLTVESTGAALYATAIWNFQTSPKLTHLTVIASGGTDQNVGVYNIYFPSSPIITDVTVSASGGRVNYGMINRDASATIRDSIIKASGGGESSQGMVNVEIAFGSYTVLVSNSQIIGSTNTISNVSASYTTRVGTSQLNGGAVSVAGGSLICAGVYDENYVFYANTCP